MAVDGVKGVDLEGGVVVGLVGARAVKGSGRGGVRYGAMRGEMIGEGRGGVASQTMQGCANAIINY